MRLGMLLCMVQKYIFTVNNENKWKEGANIFTGCKKQILGDFYMTNDPKY